MDCTSTPGRRGSPAITRDCWATAVALASPLEVEINASRSARLQSDAAFGGKPIEQRQAVNDLRGEIAALLAKAANRGALDQDLNAEDKARLVEFLRGYGDLAPDLGYAGSERSGYKVLPGAAAQVGVHRNPLALSELLKSDTLQNILLEDNILMQATMFEPVAAWITSPRPSPPRSAAPCCSTPRSFPYARRRDTRR